MKPTSKLFWVSKSLSLVSLVKAVWLCDFLSTAQELLLTHKQARVGAISTATCTQSQCRTNYDRIYSTRQISRYTHEKKQLSDTFLSKILHFMLSNTHKKGTLASIRLHNAHKWRVFLTKTYSLKPFSTIFQKWFIYSHWWRQSCLSENTVNSLKTGVCCRQIQCYESDEGCSWWAKTNYIAQDSWQELKTQVIILCGFITQPLSHRHFIHYHCKKSIISSLIHWVQVLI